MTNVSAVLTLHAPAAELFALVRESLTDPSLIDSFTQLHAPREYSGRIVEEDDGKRLVMVERDLDPHMDINGLTSWTITYLFESTSAMSTRCEVIVEFGLLLNVLSLGTATAQARNEVFTRLLQLRAYELGRNRLVRNKAGPDTLLIVEKTPSPQNLLEHVPKPLKPG